MIFTVSEIKLFKNKDNKIAVLVKIYNWPNALSLLKIIGDPKCERNIKNTVFDDDDAFLMSL